MTESSLEIARSIGRHVEITGLSRPADTKAPSVRLSLLELYDELIRSEDLRRVTHARFRDGHYSDAVFNAFLLLNNMVKSHYPENTTLDGSALMRGALSPKSGKIKLNDLVTHSERDEQQGYMDIFAGCMTGIRNPRAHEHDWEDQPEQALQMISIAQHLIEKLAASHSTAG